MAGVSVADFDSERIMQSSRYRQAEVFVQCAEDGEDVKAECYGAMRTWLFI